jgi:acetyl-CoA carboxylase biotin carboxyl carrier protein
MKASRSSNETGDVRALAELCRQAGVHELEAHDAAWSVRLQLDLSAAPASPHETAEPPSKLTSGPFVFHSQWVGVFRRADDPEGRPFVEDGQTLADGELVGLVAAMQLQHEVRVDQPGILLRFLVADGTPVEYGQPLLEIG